MSRSVSCLPTPDRRSHLGTSTPRARSSSVTGAFRLPGAALAKPANRLPGEGPTPFAVTHTSGRSWIEFRRRAELEELAGTTIRIGIRSLNADGVEPGRLAADYGTKFLVQLGGPRRWPRWERAPRARRSRWRLGGRSKHAGNGRNSPPCCRGSPPSQGDTGSETAAQVIAANVDLVFIATTRTPTSTCAASSACCRRLPEWGGTGDRPHQGGCQQPGPLRGGSSKRSRPVCRGRRQRRTGAGIDRRLHLSRGKTAVLVGSSGVGKSTLINRLLGEEVLRTPMSTKRPGAPYDRHRQLLKLPGGGLVIDTPGLREIQLWARGGGPRGGPSSTSRSWHSSADSPIAVTRPNRTVPSSRRWTVGRSTRALWKLPQLQRELRAIEGQGRCSLTDRGDVESGSLIHKSVKQHMQVKRRWTSSVSFGALEADRRVGALVAGPGVIVDLEGFLRGRSDSGTLRRLIRIRSRCVPSRIESTMMSDGARCDQTSAWRVRNAVTRRHASACEAARAISISGMVVRDDRGAQVLPGAGGGTSPFGAFGRSSRRA